MNEDASGDVLAMRLQIQQLKVLCVLCVPTTTHSNFMSIEIKLTSCLLHMLIPMLLEFLDVFLTLSDWYRFPLALTMHISLPCMAELTLRFLLTLLEVLFSYLQKEVNHLQGLVNGGTENFGGDCLSAFTPGSFSPLTFDKRLIQVCIIVIKFVPTIWYICFKVKGIM